MKLLIVGQQPYEWGFNVKENSREEKILLDPVNILMQMYSKFAFGKNYYGPGKNYRSPFWDAARKVYTSLNPEGPEHGFAWSNLLCIDSRNKRVDNATEENLLTLNLLTEEIRLIKPNVVIFFTGPRYDGCIKETFCNVRFKMIEKGLDVLEHPNLPMKSFRTYHPKYLRMSKRWKLLDEISDLIKVKK